MGQKLYTAVKSDNTEDAEKWLKRGADPNALGGHLDWTVLVQACSNGSKGMVELLLANGASVNLSSSGETPLGKAAQSGHPEVVQLLLQNGAIVNQCDKCGMTALHHAALAGVTAIVRVLLKWGGKVDVGDKSGKSPLWYAVDNGDLHCVGALLDNKANPTDTSEYQGSPLDIARKKNRGDLIAMMEDAVKESKRSTAKRPSQEYLEVPAARVLAPHRQQLYQTSATAKISDISGPRRFISPGWKPTASVSKHYQTPRSAKPMSENLESHTRSLATEKSHLEKGEWDVTSKVIVRVTEHDRDQETGLVTASPETGVVEAADGKYGVYMSPDLPSRPISALDSSDELHYQAPLSATHSPESPKRKSAEDQVNTARQESQATYDTLLKSDPVTKQSGENSTREYSNLIELTTGETNSNQTKRHVPKPMPRPRQRSNSQTVSDESQAQKLTAKGEGGSQTDTSPIKIAGEPVEQSRKVPGVSGTKRAEAESDGLVQPLKGLQRALDNVRGKATAVGNKMAPVESQAHKQLGENETSIAVKELAVEEKDRVIRNLEIEVQEKDLVIQFQDQANEEKDKVIEEKDKLIQKKDKLIQKKEEVIKENEDLLCAQISEMTSYKKKVIRLEKLLSHSEEASAQTRQRLLQCEDALRIPSSNIQMTDIRLGHGSYGEVRVAYWQGCPVAVKMLYEVLATSQHDIDRLQQEVAIAWKVHHPNISSVCGLTLEIEGKKEEKKAWIVMELLQGSLADVLNESKRRGVKPLSLREKVDVAYDCLCGLNYLHSLPRVVLHGDIRPTNILITEVMRAKLGDLGAARFSDASLTVGLVSPQYSATERIDGRSAQKTKETDVYSMGVSICELFTGIPPNRPDRLDQVQVIRHRDFRYLCMQMVSDDINRRPSAAGALTAIGRIRETDDYKVCRPRRMVKGKADGAEDITLIDLM